MEGRDPNFWRTNGWNRYLFIWDVCDAHPKEDLEEWVRRTNKEFYICLPFVQGVLEGAEETSGSDSPSVKEFSVALSAASFFRVSPCRLEGVPQAFHTFAIFHS